ncbi:HAD hydrolase-like protein [Bradyrhizobium sp. AUGA SZCCT0160]|uniref:HAD hydrolase-like protein n=1 Tax=Bradyrhizobium sp. AUGA SZCCT0160 TaxID=2807662 RepID=UPI001BA5C1D2|nr:HAD hydrolase-like protein [Bradyrhizobium sp. AUGA SZCCT0160]MBR1190743.1 HAD hydrolase-like protein [Bradyrhizobium sp. AUGA SZCCT0160]
MPRYRLAIFDFDGTLADSLPWFRTVFQDLIAKFDLAPVSAEELEGLRGRSGREIIARLNLPMWKLPAISRDMRRRKLAAANQISLFDGVPQLLADLRSDSIHAAIVSSDSEASVRQVLGPSAALIARFDCGASLFGKHHKFKRVARQLGTSPSEVLCIGDELRDIEAARAAGMDSGAVAWGYAQPAALQAAGPTHFFHTFEEIKQEFAIA